MRARLLLQHKVLTQALRFVDRDMYMRYLGQGVGHSDHTAAQGATVAQSSEEGEDEEDEVMVVEAVENNALEADEDSSGSEAETDSSGDEVDFSESDDGYGAL